jgi:hypothetical protein
MREGHREIDALVRALLGDVQQDLVAGFRDLVVAREAREAGLDLRYATPNLELRLSALVKLFQLASLTLQHVLHDLPLALGSTLVGTRQDRDIRAEEDLDRV